MFDDALSDFGGVDIGIDPNSIDYDNFGSNLTNDQIYDQLGGGGGSDFGDYTFAPEGGGALQMTQPTPEGSPNVGSPSASDLAQGSGGAEEKSILQKLTGAFEKKDGSLDFDKLVKLGTGLAGAYASYAKNRDAAKNTQAQLQKALAPNPNNNWTPQQAIWANKFFNTPIDPNRGVQRAGEGGIKSIMPSKGYAEGGGIGYPGDTRYGGGGLAATEEDPRFAQDRARDIWTQARARREREAGFPDTMQTLQRGSIPRRSTEMAGMSEILPALMQLISAGKGDNNYAQGGDIQAPEGRPAQGAFGMIEGEGDGHSDSVPINAAKGEYMVDAETVSALGNGSNEAGAHILDEWRQKLREFKRGADSSTIAESTPEQLMPPMGGEQ